MCGRYTYKLSWSEIVALYRLTLPEEPPENLGPPSYNVAPTHVMPIVRPGRQRARPSDGQRGLGAVLDQG
jgi:putative SOS response-associated peptidase YedK